MRFARGDYVVSRVILAVSDFVGNGDCLGERVATELTSSVG